MPGRVLMVQGTSSSAGKSLLVTALCRLFARRGVRVAPFKAQNMSNNAAVCADGAEIGRSQALQAEAAGVAPASDMNPVLLKPEADARSQVIVNGRPWRTLGARDYFRVRDELWPSVTGALARLREQSELVVIEGAGSPAELNLRTQEIVNMAVARHCQAPVLLVGDIERGGIFAQLLGTLWLLEPQERNLVRGLIVNKFRGDRSLFDAGVRELEERGGVPVLGVVPWLNDLDLPEEDGQALDLRPSLSATQDQIDIAVIRLPRIANFDDFDPLSCEPGVRLRFVASPRELGRPKAVILPGTKSTIADLAWLRESGLAAALCRLHAEGTAVIGICGGYQMLGERIRDPEGVESARPEVPGLGLLAIETRFELEKETHQVEALIDDDRPCPGFRGALSGYEIHMGRTTGADGWLTLTRRNGQQVRDGASSPDGRCWGCYLHGLFANDGFRQAWLAALGKHGPVVARSDSAELDRLADHVEAAMDWEHLEQIVWGADEQPVRSVGATGGLPASVGATSLVRPGGQAASGTPLHAQIERALWSSSMSDINEAHRARMQRRDEAYEKKKAESQREKGLLIVHTGAGKGKTTAALGLAFRALGQGMKVGIVQFIKGAIATGEAALVEKLDLPIEMHTLGEGFTWKTQDRERDAATARIGWQKAIELIRDPSFDMVILDELNIVLRYDYLPLEEVLAEIEARREMLHIVVTGRNAKPALIEKADLVTEMAMIKHPFRDGIKAQKGVEY